MEEYTAEVREYLDGRVLTLRFSAKAAQTGVVRQLTVVHLYAPTLRTIRDRVRQLGCSCCVFT